MAAEDKHWAKGYILDPLTAPDPSDETGLGTHFRSTFAPQTDTPTPPTSAGSSRMKPSSNNPFRRSTDSKDGTSVRARAVSNPARGSYSSPPVSASPRGTAYRQDAFAAYADEAPRTRRSLDSPNLPRPTGGTRPRGGSLGERFPGDKSGQPLDIIRRESRRAHRAPHLRKKHMPGADAIDKLDVAPGLAYHHEGPYDATLLARNTSWESSPVAAVASSNEEALKATPRENVLDSVRRHKPLDGTALVPPGGRDRLGRTYDYEEGSNMMIENGGNYKRWPGVEYHPDDIKGKGEPSFSIDRALKEHKLRGDGEQAAGLIEMQGRPSMPAEQDQPADKSRSSEQNARIEAEASSGSGRKINSLDGLKRRIGSLRRRKD